jgi:hypothetical protein
MGGRRRPVDAGTRYTLALRIHHQWCTDPFCVQPHADDWREATQMMAVLAAQSADPASGGATDPR